MIVLGFDTSMARCSAAVWRAGRVVAEREAEIERGHAEILMPMVSAVMADSGLRFSDLARIGVTRGPGSFTGLRIGLAAARGLALGSGAPGFGVTTLEAIAKGAAGDAGGRDIFVVLDTGRPQVFVQRFGPDLAPRTSITPTTDPAILLPAGPVVVAGNGAEIIRAKLGVRCGTAFTGPALPHARDVAALAAARRPHEAGALSPLYIHPSYAKVPEGS